MRLLFLEIVLVCSVLGALAVHMNWQQPMIIGFAAGAVLVMRINKRLSESVEYKQ